MTFHEYPKALTRGDDLRIVDDASQEAAARAEGFRFWSDEKPAEPAAAPVEAPKRGPGRPRKVAE